MVGPGARAGTRPAPTVEFGGGWTGRIPDLGWDKSGGESKPAVAGFVYRLLVGRRASARLGLKVGSVD